MTKSAALLEKLEQHPKFASARTVLLYYSLGDEVQTHDFVEKWHRQKTILLPVVKGDELELRQELMMGRDLLVKNLNKQVGAQVIVNIIFR